MKKIFAVLLTLLSVLSVVLLVRSAYGKYAAKIHVGSFEVSIASRPKPNLVGGKELNRYLRFFGVTEVVFDFYENYPNMRNKWGFDVGENREGAEDENRVRMHYRGGTAYVLCESEISASSCEGMFKNCFKLRRINFRNFHTNGAESMKEMFYQCFALKSLDLSVFDTSSVFDMRRMFYGCEALKSIYVSEEWSTESVMFGDEMFQDCFALTGGNGTKYSLTQTSFHYAKIDETDAKGYLTRR